MVKNKNLTLVTWEVAMRSAKNVIQIEEEI